MTFVVLPPTQLDFCPVVREKKKVSVEFNDLASLAALPIPHICTLRDIFIGLSSVFSVSTQWSSWRKILKKIQKPPSFCIITGASWSPPGVLLRLSASFHLSLLTYVSHILGPVECSYNVKKSYEITWLFYDKVESDFLFSSHEVKYFNAYL